MSCDMTSAEMDALGRMGAVDRDRFLREQRAKLQALERQGHEVYRPEFVPTPSPEFKGNRHERRRQEKLWRMKQKGSWLGGQVLTERR